MSLDDQIREAVERALTGARGHFELSIRGVAYDVARAAEAAAAEVRHKAHAQLTQFRDATLKHQDELRRSADAQIHEITRTLDEVRRTAQGEAEDARRMSHAQIEEVKRLMEQRLTEVHGRLAKAEHRLVSAGHEMHAVRKAAAAEAEELIVSPLAVAATSNDRRLAEAVEQERAAARQLDQEQTRRQVNAMRAFDDARSLGEVLEVLVQRAAREVERVAVLVSRGDRLTGWSLMGFGDQTATPRAIDLDLDEAGLAGLVIRTGPTTPPMPGTTPRCRPSREGRVPATRWRCRSSSVARPSRCCMPMHRRAIAVAPIGGPRSSTCWRATQGKCWKP